MNLKIETVKKSLKRFESVFDIPSNITNTEKLNVLITIYHEELSKHFTDESFKNAESLAWTKARKFPCVSDFFEGYGGVQQEMTNGIKPFKPNGRFITGEDLCDGLTYSQHIAKYGDPSK